MDGTEEGEAVFLTENWKLVNWKLIVCWLGLHCATETARWPNFHHSPSIHSQNRHSPLTGKTGKISRRWPQMIAAQMAAELKISFEIICLISCNQREYLRKSAGKIGKISRRCPFTKSPFTIAHSQLMTSTPSLIQILQQNKAHFQERFGLESLVLFGSYAKNNQQEESDVDLLYGVAAGNTMPLMRLQHLEQFISQLVQVSKIELVSKNHVEPIIELAIQKEGIVVF